MKKNDKIAVNTIVKNKDGEVSSCDILYVEDLEECNKQYLKHTFVDSGMTPEQVAERMDVPMKFVNACLR